MEVPSMDHINVVYWGSLDTYEFTGLGDDNYFQLNRGEVTPLPTNIASRLLKPKPREFFRENEVIPEKVKAALDKAYETYPDRVIADARKWAAKYQQYADMADHDDSKKKQAMIDGAMDTVRACERQIFDHENLKRKRKGLEELEWEESEAASRDDSGEDNENDFGEVKPRRRKAVAA